MRRWPAGLSLEGASSPRRVPTGRQHSSDGGPCGLVAVWPHVPVRVERRLGAADEQRRQVVPLNVEAEASGGPATFGRAERIARSIAMSRSADPVPSDTT